MGPKPRIYFEHKTQNLMNTLYVLHTGTGRSRTIAPFSQFTAAHPLQVGDQLILARDLSAQSQMWRAQLLPDSEGEALPAVVVLITDPGHAVLSRHYRTDVQGTIFILLFIIRLLAWWSIFIDDCFIVFIYRCGGISVIDYLLQFKSSLSS